MSLYTRNLTQDVTYWTAGATDAYGNPSWSSPVTVKGRWEDRQVKTVDFQGNEIISNSIVYLDIDLTLGDYLYNGTSTASSPITAGAKELRNFTKSPSLKGTSFIRKAIL